MTPEQREEADRIIKRIDSLAIPHPIDKDAADLLRALAAQQAQAEPATLADVLDALNVFNEPRPREGGEPWTEDDFISVKHLPDFINIIAVAWFSAPPAVRAPLTDDQIEAIWKAHVLPGFGERQKFYSPILYARAIEAAHGITQEQAR